MAGDRDRLFRTTQALRRFDFGQRPVNAAWIDGHLGAMGAPWLPLTGGTITGDLTVDGTIHANREFLGNSGDTFTSNWLNTLRSSCTYWAQEAVLSTNGVTSLIGGIRSSDFLGAPQGNSIALTGVAINDKTTAGFSASVWAGYLEAWRAAGTATGNTAIGLEIDIAERNNITTVHTPYTFAANFSAALWLASGADLGAPIYPAHVALGITDNGARFRKGIQVMATALDTAIGAGGNGVAIELARGQSLRWLNSGGTTDAEIWGDASGMHLPTIAGDVTIGGNLYMGANVGTGFASIELGSGRTGAGIAYIDLHSSVGSDYDLRLYRDPGVNGNARLINAGTGGLEMTSAGGIAMTSNLTVDGDLFFHGNTVPVLSQPGDGYSYLLSPDGGGVGYVCIGDSADPTIYYGSTAHAFTDGVAIEFAKVQATGMTVGAPTGGAMGAATLNATAVYANGSQLAPLASPSFTGDVTVAGGIRFGSGANPVLGNQFTNYTAMASPDGLTDGRAIYIGNATASSTIFYRNNTHTFQNVGAGVTYASIASGGTTFGTPTGGAKGAGTVNATAVYANGTLLTSDARLKRDIEPLPDHCLGLVRSIMPRRFRFIPREDGPPGFWERQRWGFLAQEVAAALPDAVEEDAEGNLALSVNDLVACLWKAVHELGARHGA